MSTAVTIPPVDTRPVPRVYPSEIDNPVRWVGVWLCYAFLFIGIGRVTEIIYFATGRSVRIALITMLGGLVTCVAAGNVVRVASSRIGVWLLALSAWFLCTVPTSAHKGGSVTLLRDYWLPAMIAFFIVGGLLMTLTELRRALFVIAMAILLIIVLGRFQQTDNFQLAYGTLANRNLLGQQLLFGVPFCLLPAMRHGIFSLRGLVGLGVGVAGIFAVVATGSRGTLLALAAMMLLVFLMASMINKIKLFLFLGPVMAGALLLSSSTVLTRYNTVINRINIDEMDLHSITETLSAMESSRARMFHLMQSIDLTIRNPIFGVGPGMFTVASAEDSDQRGLRAMWKQTHNTYTQISSETGLPGLVLYLGFLGSCLFTVIRIYRAAKWQNNKEFLDIAFCLLVCYCGAFACGLFANLAYTLHFPLLGALTLVFERCAEVELRRPAAAGIQPGMPGPPAVKPTLPPTQALPAVPARRSRYSS